MTYITTDKMKKIDNIYVATKFTFDDEHTPSVMVEFADGTKREYTGFETLTQAISFMNDYSEDFGYKTK